MNGLQLRDIHPAPDPGWWPPAVGWWLVAVLALMALIVIGRWAREYWRARRYRQRLLGELERIRQSHGKDPARLAAELSVLLRRVALARYPRAEVAGLTGEGWLAFLERSGGRGFQDGPGRALIEAPYNPQTPVDDEALCRLVRQWLLGQVSYQREKAEVSPWYKEET